MMAGLSLSLFFFKIGIFPHERKILGGLLKCPDGL